MPARPKTRNNPWTAAILFLFAWSVSAAGAPAMGGQVEPVLEELQARYDGTADFEADFTQETEIKTLHRTIEAAGKVYFKKPGKMLWRYQNPKGQVVLADGEFLYFYQPAQKQVLKTRLGKAFLSNTPLAFLLGIGDLKGDFQGTLISSEGPLHILRLSPKSGLAEIKELVLGVDKDGWDIQWARIEDAVGNITTVRFDDIRRDVGLEDSLFRLQVGPDVDIVELAGP